MPGSARPATRLKIGVANTGTLNLSRLVVTDVDADFFDAYEYLHNIAVNRPPGATHTRLDVCTSAAACAAGTFVVGTLSTGANPGLPAGVTADQVLGFRVTFTRADGQYLLSPSAVPAGSGNCTNASVCVDVRPRLSSPSSGAPVPAVSEDTVSAAGESNQQDPGETFDIGDAPATVTLVEAPATMDIDKDPDSRIAPGDSAPLRLVVENTGQGQISELVVEDPMPDGLVFDTNFPGGAPGQPYTVSSRCRPARPSRRR